MKSNKGEVSNRPDLLISPVNIPKGHHLLNTLSLAKDYHSSDNS
jgi:hypothetical protein